MRVDERVVMNLAENAFLDGDFDLSCPAVGTVRWPQQQAAASPSPCRSIRAQRQRIAALS
jgi:hypothetical protein